MPEAPENNADINHNEVLMEWQTPDFVPNPRGRNWYMIAGVILMSLVAYAIFSGSATMAIVLILLGGVYYLTQNQEPRIISIRIARLGIYVDKKFYPYNMINAFWVVYEPPYVRRLYLRLGTKSYTDIKVELNHQNPIEVRHLLAREIPEIEGVQESMTEILIRLLRLQ